MQAIERAMEQDEVAEASPKRRSRLSRANRPTRSWRSASVSRRRTTESGATPPRRPIAISSSCMSMKQPSMEGRAGRCAARDGEAARLRFERRRRDGGRARHARSTSAANSAPCRRLCAARCWRAIDTARFRAATGRGSSKRITSITGSTEGKRASTTWCCCAPTIIDCYTRAATGFAGTIEASTTLSARTAARFRAADIAPTTGPTIEAVENPPWRGRITRMRIARTPPWRCANRGCTVSAATVRLGLSLLRRRSSTIGESIRGETYMLVRALVLPLSARGIGGVGAAERRLDGGRSRRSS